MATVIDTLWLSNDHFSKRTKLMVFALSSTLVQFSGRRILVPARGSDSHGFPRSVESTLNSNKHVAYEPWLHASRFSPYLPRDLGQYAPEKKTPNCSHSSKIDSLCLLQHAERCHWLQLWHPLRKHNWPRPWIVASSRHSVSHGKAQKTAREKIKKARNFPRDPDTVQFA